MSKSKTIPAKSIARKLKEAGDSFSICYIPPVFDEPPKYEVRDFEEQSAEVIIRICLSGFSRETLAVKLEEIFTADGRANIIYS